MSCDSCGHWRAIDGDGTYTSPGTHGWCTLNPVWLDVKKKHFCSHEHSYITQPKTPNQIAEHDSAVRFWERRAFAEKARAIKAEKSAKDLRKKIRETTRALASDGEAR